MKILFTALMLFTGFLCYGQESKVSMSIKKTKEHTKASDYKGADPYIGMPFKVGDVKTVLLRIPVGNITISNTITYKLLPDEYGKTYRTNHTYKAYITKVTPTEKNTAVPQALTEAFKYWVISLTDKQIMSDQIVATKMDYFFSVEDYNLDGKPDFAFTGARRYHPYPVNNYVWVNINGKLVYWYGLSNECSDKEDKPKRMLSIIETTKSGNYIPKYYKVVKDTTLVPIKMK